MDSKYQKGKIYKITDVGYNKCYIGSTIEPLSNRMAKHRCHYKGHYKGLKQEFYMKCFELFNEFGLENCKIELIEEYPCNSRMELLRREGEYIKSIECVNKQIAGRTKQEWRYDNQERIHQKNIEYREKQRETIRMKKEIKILCDCGKTFTNGHKARHERTKKHQAYLQTLQV